MGVITQEVRRILKEGWHNINRVKELIILKSTNLLNLFIMRSTKELIWLFIEKNKYKVGVEKKKEALINGEFDKLPELAMAYRDKKGGFEHLNHPNTNIGESKSETPED